MFKTVAYVVVVTAAGWAYVKIFNRSLDADIDKLDKFVRDQIEKAKDR